MASDQGPVIQSAILRSELVRLRKEERGMTQEQVAGNLEWSASKLIRVEGGHSSITKVDIETDPAIMPNQLLHIAGRARDDDRVTVRVIPFTKGAHLGLSGPFTLLEFDGGLPDLLYLDTGREDITMIASDDRVSEYADTFEKLLESALPADESLEFIRIAADEMS